MWPGGNHECEDVMFSCTEGTGKSWCWMLCELLAEQFALVLTRSSIHAPLLGLGTARDAVRASQVGGAQVKVNTKVNSLVTGSKSKLGVVVLVAAVSVESPFIRVLGHDEEPCPCVVQAAEAPQERVARRRKLWFCEDVTDSGEGAHVEDVEDERLRRRASWPQHCGHGLSRT